MQQRAGRLHACPATGIQSSKAQVKERPFFEIIVEYFNYMPILQPFNWSLPCVPTF
jgi:hypothetical protein